MSGVLTRDEAMALGITPDEWREHNRTALKAMNEGAAASDRTHRKASMTTPIKPNKKLKPADDKPVETPAKKTKKAKGKKVKKSKKTEGEESILASLKFNAAGRCITRGMCYGLSRRLCRRFEAEMLARRIEALERRYARLRRSAAARAPAPAEPVDRCLRRSSAGARGEARSAGDENLERMMAASGITAAPDKRAPRGLHLEGLDHEQREMARKAAAAQGRSVLAVEREMVARADLDDVISNLARCFR